MKRFSLLILILMLIFTLCACGRRKDEKPTEPQMQPTQGATMPEVLPDMDPTLGTNIPDPTVDSNSNTMTDSTEQNDMNGNGTVTDGITDGTTGESGRSRIGRYGSMH